MLYYWLKSLDHSILHPNILQNPSCLKQHGEPREGGLRKGTNGVSNNGVTAKLMLFDRDTVWYSC